MAVIDYLSRTRWGWSRPERRRPGCVFRVSPAFVSGSVTFAQSSDCDVTSDYTLDADGNWQQTAGHGTNTSATWQSSSQEGEYSHAVNGVVLEGTFSQSASQSDNSSYTTGGSPGSGGQWVPSGTGSDTQVTSSNSNYDGSGSATAFLAVSGSYDWPSTGTQFESESSIQPGGRVFARRHRAALEGTFSQSASQSDNFSYTTGGSPGSGGQWVPSGTGSDTQVTSSNSNYDGSGSATAFLAVSGSYDWPSTGTQFESESSSANASYTTDYALQPISASGSGGQSSSASGGEGYSWQATGGNGTTSGGQTTSQGYSGGGQYTVGGGDIVGSFSQAQSDTTSWGYETQETDFPDVAGSNPSTVGWQTTSGNGTTVDSGGDSFSYSGTGSYNDGYGGGGALSQSGSASDSFSYTKDYAINYDGNGDGTWQVEGGTGGAAGSGGTFASYDGQTPCSVALAGAPSGSTAMDDQSGSNSTSYSFNTTAIFNGLDWSETGLKTSLGSGSTGDQFAASCSGQSFSALNSASFGYTEQAYLDDNGVWQGLPSAAGGEGGGTVSASASVEDPDGWDSGTATRSVGLSYTQDFTQVGNGQFQAASASGNFETLPAGITPPSPMTAGNVTNSLVSQASWPAAVDAVWGMAMTADGAPETFLGEGNGTPGSGGGIPSGFTSETMRGANVVLGPSNVAVVFPVTDVMLDNGGLNGVSAGTAAGGVASGQVSTSNADVGGGPMAVADAEGGGARVDAGTGVNTPSAARDTFDSIEPVCFAAGTPVPLADGTTKPIERIERGEKVLAASHEDPEGPVSAGEVVEVYHHEPRSLVEVEVGGDLIRVTPKHPFYVRDSGWTAASELRPGDSLRTAAGGWVAVGSVADNGQVEPVYNIQVAALHTYFVRNGAGNIDVLVHNDSGGGTGGPAGGGVQNGGTQFGAGTVTDGQMQEWISGGQAQPSQSGNFVKVAGANGQFYYYKKMIVHVQPSLSRSGYQYTLYRLAGTLGGNAPNGGNVTVLDGIDLDHFPIQQMRDLIRNGHATKYAGGQYVTVRAVLNGEVKMLRFALARREAPPKHPNSLGVPHFYEYELDGEVSDVPSTLSVAFTGDWDWKINSASVYQRSANDEQLTIRSGESWATIDQELDELISKGQFGDVVLSGHGIADGAALRGGYTTPYIYLSNLKEGTPQYEFLQKLGANMAPGGVITLEHCNVAKYDDGQKFIVLMAKITGHKVVAYDDWYAFTPHGWEWTATPSSDKAQRGRFLGHYRDSLPYYLDVLPGDLKDRDKGNGRIEELRREEEKRLRQERLREGLDIS